MSFREFKEDLKPRLWRWMHPHERVGLALGVFDFCHQGHVNLLRHAADHCDRLVVGIHTDAEVERYKGVRPMNSALERRARILDLGLADVVEIGSDRDMLCQRHRVNVVFHGDDWNREDYMDHWGRARITQLGVDIQLLAHTPGIDSTGMRERTPRIGWWIYSKLPTWDRSHIFDHLDNFYTQVGGVWIAGTRGREAVKRVHREAPCAWIPDRTELPDVCRHAAALELDVLVTAHFNYGPLVDALKARGRPVSLVVLSHGRSGKAGTSADVHRALGEGVSRQGCVTIHDWSFDPDTYGHFDAFLAGGGTFHNDPPKHPRPRLLVLPTWGPGTDARGLLLSKRWRGALRKLSATWQVVISPHPHSEPWALRKLTWGTSVQVMEGRGRSFEAVPEADAVLCDLSGVFWESLAFDTPVLLASAKEPFAWAEDLAPSVQEVGRIVSTVEPGDLVEHLNRLIGTRAPGQKVLAAQRLGNIDGNATERVSNRLLDLSQGVDLHLNSSHSFDVPDLPLLRPRG